MSNLPKTSGHARETTMVSFTDTVIDGGEAQSPSSVATAFGNDMPVVVSTSPERPTFDKPKPVRESTFDPRKASTTIPPEHPNRTLVLCFDGTGDQFDADNSNIVQLFSMLKKDDHSKQMVYYQSGIGTYTSPEVASPVSAKISKTIDEMIAWNLDAHLMDGYEFLMQNYVAGDRICIFGFSRGAYTARALAGMVHKVGLLPAYNHQQVPFAYKMYTRADKIGWEQSNAFKRAFSNDVDIEFIGVWDTVSSVGLIPRRLPFTTSNTLVRTFRHALALDEHRAKFKANLWNLPTEAEMKMTESTKIPPRLPINLMQSGRMTGNSTIRRKPSKSSTKDTEDDVVLAALERQYSERDAHPSDVEEVWFSGCHCDIGGGSVSNEVPHSLARISLRWMIRECFKTDTGIMFDAQRLREIGLDPATLYPFVTPRPPPLPIGSSRVSRLRSESRFRRTFAFFSSKTKSRAEPRPGEGRTRQTSGAVLVGTEEEEELLDTISPVYDQLKLNWYWWILEVIPLTSRYQRGDDSWVSLFGWNLGRPRFIPKQTSHGVKVHRSVQVRMQALYDGKNKKSKRYTPRAKLNVAPTWVD